MSASYQLPSKFTQILLGETEKVVDGSKSFHIPTNA